MGGRVGVGPRRPSRALSDREGRIRDLEHQEAREEPVTAPVRVETGPYGRLALDRARQRRELVKAEGKSAAEEIERALRGLRSAWIKAKMLGQAAGVFPTLPHLPRFPRLPSLRSVPRDVALDGIRTSRYAVTWSVIGSGYQVIDKTDGSRSQRYSNQQDAVSAARRQNGQKS